MPLWQFYQQWINRKVPINHCIACCVREAICHEDCSTRNEFCSEDCQRHFHHLQRVPLLMAQHSHQLGIKRLLEPSLEDLDRWQWLPIEIQVAILEVTFPLRENDWRQFHALSELRLVSQRVRDLIEKHVWPRLRSLPKEYEEVVVDMEPFRGLLSFSTIGRISIGALFDGIEWPRHLHTLTLPAADVKDVPHLPYLTNLDLTGSVYGRTGSAHGRNLSLERFSALKSLSLLNVRDSIGTLISSLTTLQHLTSLYYDGDGDAPVELTQLTRLNHLSLGAAMRGDDLLKFVNLTSLEFISLFTDPFRGLSVAQLGELRELHTLTYYATPFDCGHLQAWPSLRALRITYIRIIERPQMLVLATGLTDLRLENSADISAEWVSELVNLTRLDWVGMDSRCLYNMTNLIQLDAHCSGVTDEKLTRLQLLQHLNVSGCPYITMASLTTLRELVYIDISRNRIDRNLTSLIRLPLQCLVKLDQEPAVSISEMTRVELMNVEDPSVSQ